jgi:hypothetical protein
MQHPPQFASADRVWHRKPAVRIAGAAAVLLLGAVVSARALSGRPKSQTKSQSTTAAAPTPPVVAPEPVKVPPAAQPTAQPAQPTAQPAQPTAVGADGQAAPAIASARADAARAAGAGGTGEAVAKDEAPPAGDEAEAPAAQGTKDEPREAAKEKVPLAQLPVLIKSDPEGSRVATGRHVFGTTPLTLKLRPGNSYDLTFTRAGYTTLTRRYKFDGHGPQIFRVSLKKVPEVHKTPTPTATAPKPAPPPPRKNGFFAR